MSLEQQLREALRDVAARLHPDPERAYQRFRRRRWRRLVPGTPAFAVATVAAVLVATVAVAQLRPEPSQPARPSPSPTPSPSPNPYAVPPLDWQPGGRTVEMPAAGYSIEVPDGWLFAVVDPEVRPGPGALRLRPESEPRAEIEVGTVALKPELGPGKGEHYPATTHFSADTFPDPSGPHTFSRRPDGRRVMAAGEAGDGDDSYFIAWPYYCASGQDCPIGTKLRTLRVRFFAPEAAWPEVRRVGESIVANARPITNALEGGDPSTPRDECETLTILRAGGSSSTRPGVPSDVIVGFEIDNGAVVSCQTRLELALRVLENGQPAQVRYSPGRETVVFEGPSPEQVGPPGEPSRVVWRWTNWCGARDVELEFLVNGQPYPDPPNPLGSLEDSPPPCVDPDQPSDLAVFELEE